jgi:uncharacterized lipoprotein YddW (UPF0748 family)
MSAVEAELASCPMGSIDRERRHAALLGLALWLTGCVQAPPLPPSGLPAVPAGEPGTAEMPPPEPREFRAAWVSTVANIDWPSRPGLAPQAQRAEAVAILERARTLGLNAVILQVRPAGDAIYPSALEPWSEFLTGTQGRPPEPAYDPLAFWLEQAHRRGLQLHAWFNPYRARHSAARSPLARPHLALREPRVVRRYGDMLWMDPGEPAAFAHTLEVMADVLRRYDLDGVHIDDYFYPYPVGAPGAEQPFPDDDSYARYVAAGGQLGRDPWRRANVDAMVQAMHRTVRALRPQALFGISPFGIGRPDRRPAGVTGFSQFDKLFADVERWLEEGWLDYLAPQLYWPIERAGQAFPVLLDYWLAANRRQRHLWPGLFTSNVRTSAADAAGARNWPARELLEQVALTRTRPAAGGHIHFSMAALMQDRDRLATLLQFGPYAEPALVPATPWLESEPPPPPSLLPAPGRVRIDVPQAPARWAVWRRIDGRWRFAVQAAAERSIDPKGADRVVVSAVGRTGQISERRFLRLTT